MLGHQKIFADLQSLARGNALSHAYLFHGPSMVGKKRAARMLAEYLESEGLEQRLKKDERSGVVSPIGHYASTAEENAILNDCTMIEPMNGSIGIDAVREIKNFLWQKPNASPRRTLVIDDAELLTAEAQNALLKITEEPPESSLLILVAADAEALMPTLLSRLEKVYFGLVPEREIAAWLGARKKEKGTRDKESFPIQRSMGKPGLAWRLVHDEELKKNIALAENFLKSQPATRRDFIKKLIEPEEFDLNRFLDAVIMVLAWNRTGNQKPATGNRLWHKALALREREANFSLNPRLQLENLLSV
ncbi:MAG: hypothetical protein KGJ13_07345 [Patescibacteria group bacterium]|nr:hypothetical protein [Patescibacteria group bacterium]